MHHLLCLQSMHARYQSVVAENEALRHELLAVLAQQEQQLPTAPAPHPLSKEGAAPATAIGHGPSEKADGEGVAAGSSGGLQRPVTNRLLRRWVMCM